MSIIKVNEEALREATDALSHIDGAIGPAVAKALNRSIVAARSESVKAVRKRYSYHGDVRKGIKLARAKSSSLEASLTNRSSASSLYDFDVSPSTPDPRRRRPIAAEVIVGERSEIEDSFIAEMQSTKVGVFRRVGRARLPIKMFYGPSVAQMIGHDDVVNATEDRAASVMLDQLGAEVDAAIAKAGGRSS